MSLLIGFGAVVKDQVSKESGIVRQRVISFPSSCHVLLSLQKLSRTVRRLSFILLSSTMKLHIAVE